MSKRLLEAPISEDLAPFSRHLWLRRIAHRVFEESGQQVLELARAEDADAARRDFEDWRSGALQLVHPDELPQAKATGRPIWQRTPVLLGVIGVTLLGYFTAGTVRLDQGLAALMTIVDLRVAGDSLAAVLARGELWRPLTPVFLHFSIAHLLFNCAVVWEVGRRVELADSGGRLLLLVVLIGVLSNLAQYWIGGAGNFGGLSGVAYGLVGYVMVRGWLHPNEALWQLPRGIATGLLIFLVLFTTGITEPFGLYVANGAHWGGLVVGALLGFLFPGRYSASPDARA